MIKRKHSACASSCSPAVINQKKHWIVQVNDKSMKICHNTDIGPIQINFWWREPRMSENRW